MQNRLASSSRQRRVSNLLYHLYFPIFICLNFSGPYAEYFPGGGGGKMR